MAWRHSPIQIKSQVKSRTLLSGKTELSRYPNSTFIRDVLCFYFHEGQTNALESRGVQRGLLRWTATRPNELQRDRTENRSRTHTRPVVKSRFSLRLLLFHSSSLHSQWQSSSSSSVRHLSVPSVVDSSVTPAIGRAGLHKQKVFFVAIVVRLPAWSKSKHFFLITKVKKFSEEEEHVTFRRHL